MRIPLNEILFKNTDGNIKYYRTDTFEEYKGPYYIFRGKKFVGSIFSTRATELVEVNDNNSDYILNLKRNKENETVDRYSNIVSNSTFFNFTPTDPPSSPFEFNRSGIKYFYVKKSQPSLSSQSPIDTETLLKAKETGVSPYAILETDPEVIIKANERGIPVKQYVKEQYDFAKTQIVHVSKETYELWKNNALYTFVAIDYNSEEGFSITDEHEKAIPGIYSLLAPYYNNYYEENVSTVPATGTSTTEVKVPNNSSIPVKKVEKKEEPKVNKTSLESCTGKTTWPVVASDLAFAKKYCKGILPAVLCGDGSKYIVDNMINPKSKKPRAWLKPNKEYLPLLTTIKITLSDNTVKTLSVHPELATPLSKALTEINNLGLNKYIKSTAGTLAIRNVTGGVRLSNHSWAMAIDLNSSMAGYKFGCKWDIVNQKITCKEEDGSTTTRSWNDFDKGYYRMALVMKKNGLTWLASNDPMHFSVHE